MEKTTELKPGDIVDFYLNDGKTYQGKIVTFLNNGFAYISNEKHGRLFVSRERLTLARGN